LAFTGEHVSRNRLIVEHLNRPYFLRQRRQIIYPHLHVFKSGFLTPFVTGRFSLRLGRPFCSKGLLKIVALLLQALQFF
jgi:hypothetical protein